MTKFVFTYNISLRLILPIQPYAAEFDETLPTKPIVTKSKESLTNDSVKLTVKSSDSETGIAVALEYNDTPKYVSGGYAHYHAGGKENHDIHIWFGGPNK